jgi:hypothetical protein
MPTLKNAALLVALASCAFQANSQPVSPMGRYNRIAERMYQLERCSEMTQERWEWLESVRSRAQRGLGWNEAVTQEHDKLLIVDFNARYRDGIAKEHCEELAHAADREREKSRRLPRKSG